MIVDTRKDCLLNDTCIIVFETTSPEVLNLKKRFCRDICLTFVFEYVRSYVCVIHENVSVIRDTIFLQECTQASFRSVHKRESGYDCRTPNKKTGTGQVVDIKFIST
jgi:hypothetical protein